MIIMTKVFRSGGCAKSICYMIGWRIVVFIFSLHNPFLHAPALFALGSGVKKLDNCLTARDANKTGSNMGSTSVSR
jgi:hypothetical protein